VAPFDRLLDEGPKFPVQSRSLSGTEKLPQ
jgi:hypothetical protein